MTCSSDRRFKTDIQDAPEVLTDLAKLRIRRCKIKSTGEESVGVIAQEVQELEARNDRQQAEIDGLEKELRDLKAK